MEAVFADTGSSIQYMAAADEANQRITNTQMQYQFEVLNQDVALKAQSLEQKMQQYMSMVQQGQMSAIQYMDMRQRGYEGLLNGYLSKAQTQMQEFGIGQQADISALTGAMGAEEARLGFEEREQLANLENQRASLQAALQGAEASAQMDLQAQLANIDNQIRSLTGALGGAQATAGMDLQAQIASGQMNLDSLVASLSGIQGMSELQLQASAQDMEALNMQLGQVYNSIMIQTGINTSIMEGLSTAYDTTMKPLLDALNVLLAKENLSAQDMAYALELQAIALQESAQEFEEKWGWTNLIPNISIGF